MLNSILNSLDTHIAVINHEGRICYVNEAWKRFAVDNGMQNKDMCWEDYNYLSICQHAANADDADDDACHVLDGLQQVLNGKRESFEYEYPCHSPTARRWYVFKTAPLKQKPGCFLISHDNSTKNKLQLQQTEQLSIEDYLTKLYNRRGLETLAEKEFSRAKRDKSEISLMVFDVDNFKLFNDYFGHVAGDLCLKRIAAVIKAYARRPGDIAARIGGDEFVLVLSKVSQKQAVAIMESISRKIQQLNLIITAGQQVTISAGCSTAIPTCAKSDLQTLYYNADQELYVAKHQRSSSRSA
jgi:diguanylate cyclase (GGDEF)-like protein